MKWANAQYAPTTMFFYYVWHFLFHQCYIQESIARYTITSQDIVYQPKTEFKERRTPTSQHSAKKKKSAPSPHLKESFLLLCSKERAKGEKRGEKKR